MVAHDLGGGIRRHIDSLVQRLRDRARILLLEATDRGATLSVPSLPHHPTLTLPAERLDDLILLLRSMAVSRVHIHSLLGMDMDIRALIHRLDVPFDMSPHDYYSVCPQINLLPWRHSLYCGMPDVAGCNACIAHRSSHGATDIVTWRAEQAWQFKEAARVLCPSHDVLARLGQLGFVANTVVAPYDGVPPGRWPLRIVPPKDGPDADRGAWHAGRSQGRPNACLGGRTGRPENDRDPSHRPYRRGFFVDCAEADESNGTLR